jgi:hypothetical protein
MTAYFISNISAYANHGQNCEASLAYEKTGCLRKHGNLKWYEGSDIPEFDMSVKSAKFSLCSGGQLKGSTMSEMLDDYFARVASKTFAYVSREFKVYEMDASEFRTFVTEFGYLTRESEKNGSKTKIRARDESRKMVEWLEARA